MTARRTTGEMKELGSLLRHRKEESKKRLDQALSLDAWLRDLERLMETVRVWLGDLVEDDLITVLRKQVDIQEEGVAPYKAPGLRILTPGDRIVGLEPIGMSIMNADGRVDMVSMTKRLMILRFAPRKWCFVRPSQRTMEWDSEPVTRESFLREFRRMIE